MLRQISKLFAAQQQCFTATIKSGVSLELSNPKTINKPIPTQIRSISQFFSKAMTPETKNSKTDLATAVNSSLDDTLEDNKEALETLREHYSAAMKDSADRWLEYNKTCHIYLYRGGGLPSENLAAYDLDGTIIKPKSNKRIPKSATDWQFFSVWTKVRLQQVVRENDARFVIFTNQNGVGLRLVALEEIQERIELVMKRLQIPCIVFVAIEKDEFRKPETGMFRLFEKVFNSSKEINYSRSFYCGDAVGYPSHSDADIKFAQKLELPFLPPEKFLRGVKPKLVPENVASTKKDPVHS